MDYFNFSMNYTVKRGDTIVDVATLCDYKPRTLVEMYGKDLEPGKENEKMGRAENGKYYFQIGTNVPCKLKLEKLLPKRETISNRVHFWGNNPGAFLAKARS